jgi:hypothetical protein
LNGASAYFDGGLVEMKQVGEHYVASTRNNVAGRCHWIPFKNWLVVSNSQAAFEY